MNLFQVLSEDINIPKNLSTLGQSLSRMPAPKSMDLLVESKMSTDDFNSKVHNKPILQLNALPMTISPKEFENARSSENPNGSLNSLWAFRQLVDPIPTFSKYYNPSSNSTESTYMNIVNGASADRDSIFAQQIIADARRDLNNIRYNNMDGTPGTWAPIHVTPSDWYDVNNNRYKKIKFNLNKAGDPDSPFSVIGGSEFTNELQTKSSGSQIETKLLDKSSKIKNVTMKYLQVSLSRQWYNEMLFSTNGWSLSGQSKGFCSSGDIDNNSGIFSLVPSSVIFGYDLSVEASWSLTDQLYIEKSRKSGKQVSIDNLVFHPAKGESDLQVIGWVTTLIPYSPSIAG